MNGFGRRNCAFVLAVAAVGLGGCDTGDPDACLDLARVQARIGEDVTSPIEWAFSFADYKIEDGTVKPVYGTDCAAAVASRLQNNACELCKDSPGQCEALVRSIFDNPPVGTCVLCGDGLCSSPEDDVNCPTDCSSSCGDQICDEATENAFKCPLDCASACGDGICATGETPEGCPNDCTFAIGDGQCEYGENPINSPQDCTGAEACNHGGICDVSTCGDGFCQSFENSIRCPEDCCMSMCDPETASQNVCLGGNVVRCTAEMEGGCPGFELVEACEQGCLDGQCAVCPQDGTWGGCEPRCSGDSIRVCFPHPTLPGCSIAHEYQACSEFGADYTCVPNLGCAQRCTTADCNLNETRCIENARLETCTTLPGSSCRQWVLTNICLCDSRERQPTCLDQ